MKNNNLTKLAVCIALTATTALLAQPRGPRPGDRQPPRKEPQKHGFGYDYFSEGDYVEPKRGPAPRPAPAPHHGPAPAPHHEPAPHHGPAPHPAPLPPPRPAPPPVPHHGPAPDYRPGHHGLFHSRPHARDYYRTWRFLRSHDFFRFDVLPSTLQIAMRNFTATEFDLEENSTTGYSWFARYDSTYCNVAITHYAPAGIGIVGHPGKANIRITAKYPGDTLVEFIYARRWEWERGAAPANVIQLFVHVDP